MKQPDNSLRRIFDKKNKKEFSFQLIQMHEFKGERIKRCGLGMYRQSLVKNQPINHKVFISFCDINRYIKSLCLVNSKNVSVFMKFFDLTCLVIKIQSFKLEPFELIFSRTCYTHPQLKLS